MKKLILPLLVSLLLFSCQKGSTAKGTVRDFGPVELDGCGWVIEIDNQTFKPVNLEPQFQIDELEIDLDYKSLGSMANCGLQADAFDEIEIINVY